MVSNWFINWPLATAATSRNHLYDLSGQVSRQFAPTDRRQTAAPLNQAHLFPRTDSGSPLGLDRSWSGTLPAKPAQSRRNSRARALLPLISNKQPGLEFLAAASKASVARGVETSKRSRPQRGDRSEER